MAVRVDVASIEKLVVGVTGFTTVHHVRTDIIEIAESAREVDMGGVC